MQLSHQIELIPTPSQVSYFYQACGTARFVWNWALAEWNRQEDLGLSPNAMALKKQFNAIKYQEFPWLTAIHRDAHAQPFSHLAKAWRRFFTEIKKEKTAHPPRFKKKGRCRDSFYVANDKFELEESRVKLPKLGWLSMRESLRFSGKVLGASVVRRAHRWFISIQVDVPDNEAYLSRKANGVQGVDLGIKAAATLADGDSVDSPKPLKSALRRLKIRSRRLSRKIGYQKQTKTPASNNRHKASMVLGRLHFRVACIRNHFIHQLTHRLCSENQTVVIEDLNVKGMLANDKLARAISDVGFGEFRRQMEYKSKRFGTELIIADRFFPSSKLCSHCGWKNADLTLKDRHWTCQQCLVHHDRDLNAAQNLKGLATPNALPVASGMVTNHTEEGIILLQAGKSRLSDTNPPLGVRGRNKKRSL